MKRKRFVKVNARKVQESDIALGTYSGSTQSDRNEPRRARQSSWRVISADPEVRERHEPHKLGTPNPNRQCIAV
jgi:hypothetical protein